ncbi:hypothetical protein COO91_06343 [Nostoc flagelliforme CCNUN1]|uniref:Uncharacterized protein n=1 Tax=Nostoc flagelliforme CCNUN1 TaxID=2038116 RepID=A0A2K8SY20_9NOSO|nr:hypothetical protein COO91_06343 [Nostoc flagelliforme CCNUN1]
MHICRTYATVTGDRQMCSALSLKFMKNLNLLQSSIDILTFDQKALQADFITIC